MVGDKQIYKNILERIDVQAEIHARDALQEAIEELYTVFSSYTLVPHIDGCSHCVSENDHKRIYAKPLRALTAADLNLYYWKAMTTWGNVEDFKHFLPRLLEILAFERHAFEASALISKLTYANWRSWSKAEQEAIEKYLLAWWHMILSSFKKPQDSLDVIEFLDSIQHITHDLTPYLTAWRQMQTVSALRHLADFVLCGGYYYKGGHQITEWLFEPATLQTLEQAYYTYHNEPYEKEFIDAHDMLYAMMPERG